MKFSKITLTIILLFFLFSAIACFDKPNTVEAEQPQPQYFSMGQTLTNDLGLSITLKDVCFSNEVCVFGNTYVTDDKSERYLQFIFDIKNDSSHRLLIDDFVKIEAEEENTLYNSFISGYIDLDDHAFKTDSKIEKDSIQTGIIALIIPQDLNSGTAKLTFNDETYLYKIEKDIRVDKQIEYSVGDEILVEDKAKFVLKDIYFTEYIYTGLKDTHYYPEEDEFTVLKFEVTSLADKKMDIFTVFSGYFRDVTSSLEQQEYFLCVADENDSIVNFSRDIEPGATRDMYLAIDIKKNKQIFEVDLYTMMNNYLLTYNRDDFIKEKQYIETGNTLELEDIGTLTVKDVKYTKIINPPSRKSDYSYIRPQDSSNNILFDFVLTFDNKTEETILSKDILGARVFYQDGVPLFLEHGIISKNTTKVATDRKLDPEYKSTIHCYYEVEKSNKGMPCEIELFFNDKYYYIKVDSE